jgi:hypothetical protein
LKISRKFLKIFGGHFKKASRAKMAAGSGLATPGVDKQLKYSFNKLHLSKHIDR